eukprot:scaffold1302_cov114-Isochrysis_galbana.AAC.9
MTAMRIAKYSPTQAPMLSAHGFTRKVRDSAAAVKEAMAAIAPPLFPARSTPGVENSTRTRNNSSRVRRWMLWVQAPSVGTVAVRPRDRPLGVPVLTLEVYGDAAAAAVATDRGAGVDLTGCAPGEEPVRPAGHGCDTTIPAALIPSAGDPPLSAHALSRRRRTTTLSTLWTRGCAQPTLSATLTRATASTSTLSSRSWRAGRTSGSPSAQRRPHPSASTCGISI